MDFTEKLRLKGKAEEDMYFARLDRQLIEAMHEKQKQEEAMLKGNDEVDPEVHTSRNAK
ncbi:hypothetical protein [Vibrio sp. CAU 1672]|uniref:hypothetical protein n=1 Tax=Vibrio sp. CAU 1672 TaxID=3032594 RepID=UPI0023DC38E1|nr:hypothetical protein [Vibrio sp. CAU 1672]MDF2152096.1 hypothetical protein [Vibrio sp. CAU 1672]